MKRTVFALILTLWCTLPATAQRLERGVAFGEQVLVRADPTVDSAAHATLADGDAVLVLEQSAERSWFGTEKDHWYRVEQASGVSGWVHGSQLLRGSLEGRITGSSVRMRQTPAGDGVFIQSLSGGSWVDVLDRTPESETIGGRTARWFHVRTGRSTGWVFGAYLQLSLRTPAGAHAPFLGWRCLPGHPSTPHPTETQILAGLVRWRRTVQADIAQRLQADDGDTARQLAAAWDALQRDAADEAHRAVEPLTALDEDVATPLGSARAAGALMAALAVAAGDGSETEITAAFTRAIDMGRGAILTGTDWATPADLAAFDRYLFIIEHRWKKPRQAREWVAAVAADTAQSGIVRAAAGVANVRLQFAAQRETAAVKAARGVFLLGADAQLSCGPAPVHFGATALTLACDALEAVGGGADAATLCESVVRAGEPMLQAVARARLARLHDIGTADVDTVVSAYERVPEFQLRLADLRTLNAGDSAARAAALRAVRDRVGGSNQAWVTGDRVRLRSLPSTRGAVLAALRRDTVVRLLYRAPAWAVQDDVPWIKVHVRGGQTGWMSERYLEVKAPRVPAMPAADGLLWNQMAGGPDGRGIAPGEEIDQPVILWSLPDILSASPALGDINGDGIADLIVTGVLGDRACPQGVAILDGQTQGEFWRAATAGCVDARGVAVGETAVVVVSGAGTVEAFSLENGGLMWSWTAEAGTLTAPVLDADRVAVGGSDGSVTVLHLDTGRVLLRARLGAPVVVRPVLVGQTLYAVTDRHVSAVDLGRRKARWRAKLMRGQTRATAEGQLAGGIAVDNDTVFAAAPNGVLIACTVAKGKALWQVDMGGTPVGGPISDGQRVMVALATGDVRAWTVAEGTPAWRTTVAGPIASGMLLADHTLVLGTTDGVVSGVSRMDGRVRWYLDLRVPLDRGPAGGAGRVAIGSAGGPLFVLGDASLQAASHATPLRGGAAAFPRSD